MVFYYNKNGESIETREKPLNAEFISRERAIPKPVEDGYIAKLVVDVKNDKVFYELLETEEHKKRAEIELLKQKLNDTDYQAIKYAEGQISEEGYAPIKEQRQAWRDRINELEESLEIQIEYKKDESDELVDKEDAIEVNNELETEQLEVESDEPIN